MSARLPRFGLSLVLTLGLAACSEGCAHELPVARAQQRERMQFEQLEQLLWPKDNERYLLMTEAELEALERLVAMLYARAEVGSFRAMQEARVAADAQLAGVELHDIELEIEGRIERLWVVVEPVDDRRGRGSYLFRLGALEGESKGIEHVLQAPHSRYDEGSGEIALRMFVERLPEVAPARALLLNSVNRYMQFNGERKKQKHNPADAAHRKDHPLARATAVLLSEEKIALVQLHGFERDEAQGDPDVIVSSGEKKARAASRATTTRLAASLGQLPVRHYGDKGFKRLGGTSNVQGRAARNARRCFVHVETSARLRERLRQEWELRRSFATALFGGDAEEFRDGCH